MIKNSISVFRKSRVFVVWIIAIAVVLSTFLPVMSLGKNAIVLAEGPEEVAFSATFDENADGWGGEFVYCENGGENDSGCVKPNVWASISKWRVPLKANTTYTYSFYVGGDGGAARFYIQLENPFVATETYLWSSSNTSQGFVYGEFITTTEAEYILFLKEWGGANLVTYDSFKIVEGSLENGDEPDVPDEPEGPEGSGSTGEVAFDATFDENADGWGGEFVYCENGGENDSGCVKPNAWASISKWRVPLKANTTYTYSFYVGGDGGAARFYIQLENPFVATETHLWSSANTTQGFVYGEFTTTTEAEYILFLKEWGGVNLVTYDSFKIVEGSLEDNKEQEGSGSAGEVAFDATFDTDAAGWGGEYVYCENGGENDSGCVKPNAWGSVSKWRVPLKANTTYTYSFYVGGDGGAARFYIQLENPFVATETHLWSSANTTQGFVYGEFTTTTEAEYILFLKEWGGANLVTYDSFKIVEGSLADNGGAGGNGGTGEPDDTEKSANLLKNPNLDASREGWSGLEYSSSNGEENTGCLKSLSWDAASQIVSLEADTTYSFGFYLTGKNAKAKLFIQTANPWTNNTHAVWENLSINGSEYVTGTITVSTAGNYWFFLREWGGSGTAYFDSFYLIKGTDLSVLQNNGDNLIKNPCVNFNTDNWYGDNFKSEKNAHAETKGVLLEKNGNIYQENILMTKDTTYTYSFWLKPIGNNGNLKFYIVNENKELVWSASGNNLKEGFAEGTIVPQETGYYKFLIENDGSSNILLDTFALIKGTEYEPPVNGIIPGTEMQPQVSNYHVKTSFVAESENVFLNGDFETTPANGTSWNVEGFAEAEGFSLDSADAKNGNKSLKFTGGEVETELRITLPVTMHTTYTLGAWVKGGYLSTEYPGEVRFGIVDKNDDFIGFAEDAKRHTSLESSKTSFARDMRWHRVGFEFYTGDYKQVTFVIRGKNALMWFDDFVLSESANCVEQPAKVLAEPVVSDKYTTSTPSCAPADNIFAKIVLNNADYWKDTIITRETVKVTKDPRNTANEVLYYDAGNHISHSYYSRSISVKKNTDYIFTAFYRADVENESGFGFYRRTDWASPIVFNVSASEPGDWKFVTFNFNTKDYEELVFYIQDNGGNLVLDDLRLFEASKGIALDTDAQLRSMNSALIPLDSENDKEQDNSNNIQPEKDETLDNNQSENVEDSDSNQSENVENSDGNQTDNEDKNDTNSGSGITELKDSSTNIKFYYEDGREIRTTVTFKATEVSNDKLPSAAVELLEGMKLSAFKLSLLENGEEILPNGRVLIELPLPDGFDGEECFVYRITDEGKVTNVRAKFEDGKLKFTVDKMGTFAVAQTEEANNLIWFVLGGIAVLVLVAGIAIFFLIKKKKVKN